MWPPIKSLHMAKKLPPIHPGEILREEFLVSLKLTPYAAAAALHVPRTRIERIAREEKPVTADTALRLGKFFKTGAAFWMKHSGALRSRNGRRRARAADQEDCVLSGGVRAMWCPWSTTARCHNHLNLK
jgi:addiction module HigA family antidote